MTKESLCISKRSLLTPPSRDGAFFIAKNLKLTYTSRMKFENSFTYHAVFEPAEEGGSSNHSRSISSGRFETRNVIWDP